MSCVTYLFFFFFQAEDGIRDGRVTGVQTCALPIYPSVIEAMLTGKPYPVRALYASGVNILVTYPNSRRSIEALRSLDFVRSEERRVGKECRCRWAAYPVKKKIK